MTTQRRRTGTGSRQAWGWTSRTISSTASFLGSALRGDFGESIKEGRPSMEVIIERIPATLQLGLAAFIFSVVVGVPLGILSAVKRGSFLDMSGKVVALVGQSAPVFWLGLMLVFLFSVRWNDWFGDSLVPPYGPPGTHQHYLAGGDVGVVLRRR